MALDEEPLGMFVVAVGAPSAALGGGYHLEQDRFAIATRCSIG